MAIEAAEARGWSVVAEQVAIAWNRGREMGAMVVDLVLQKGERLLFLEVKHGPSASLARLQPEGLLALARGQARISARGLTTIARAPGRFKGTGIVKGTPISPDGTIGDAMVSVLWLP